MHIHHCYTLRNLILTAVLTIGFASSAFAQGFSSFIVDLNSKEATDLGTLGGAEESWAYDINDAGRVVGESHAANAPSRAFITGPDGAGMTDLGTLGGNSSHAYGINDMGQVVGESTARTNPYQGHAFITGPDGVGMTALGTLGGFSRAFGINEMGQVAGVAEFSTLRFHAFITGPNGVGMTDLGTLGGDYSIAYGINDAGQVVGESTIANGQTHAFITGPNGVGMTDLNSVVNPPTGLTFFSANAINNNGQLAAVGVVPEPEMYAMLLSGLGLIGFLARGRATA
jgi:probable HAF family extracellular repeat protein